MGESAPALALKPWSANAFTTPGPRPLPVPSDTSTVTCDGAGSVRLDGVDLRTADPAAVRMRFALVPQDPVIFAANVWENVRYGRPAASDDEVRAACEAAESDAVRAEAALLSHR